MQSNNLIAGLICLAVLPCFALFAVAQEPPAPQGQRIPDIKIPPGFNIRYEPHQTQTVIRADAVQRVQPTHLITMPPSFSIRYELPKPFASVVSGNTNIAAAVQGSTDRVLVINSQPDAQGQTNFLLVDRDGREVGNIVVTVQSDREPNKVVIHNKKDNVAGYTNYICNPICVRVGDPMEGGDRVPLRNLSSQTFNQTINQPTTNPTIPPTTTALPGASSQ